MHIYNCIDILNILQYGYIKDSTRLDRSHQQGLFALYLPGQSHKHPCSYSLFEYPMHYTYALSDSPLCKEPSFYSFLFPFRGVSLCRSRTGSPLDRQLTSVCGLGALDAVYIPCPRRFNCPVCISFFLNTILLLIFISLYRSLPSYLDIFRLCWAPTCLDDLHSTLIIRTTVHNTSFSQPFPAINPA